MRPLLLLFAGVLVAQNFVPRPERIQFALIGDQQYTATQEKLFENVIDSMNKEKLAFVVHDGDIWFLQRNISPQRAAIPA